MLSSNVQLPAVNKLVINSQCKHSYAVYTDVRYIQAMPCVKYYTTCKYNESLIKLSGCNVFCLLVAFMSSLWVEFATSLMPCKLVPAWKREITFVSAFKTSQFDRSTILNLNLSSRKCIQSFVEI